MKGTTHAAMQLIDELRNENVRLKDEIEKLKRTIKSLEYQLDHVCDQCHGLELIVPRCNLKSQITLEQLWRLL